MDDLADALTLTARDVPPGTVVVSVAGELDMATVPELDDFVRDRLHTGRALVLDLSGVTFLGSTGLNLLLDLRNACEAADTALWLAAVPKAVLRPMRLTDLDGQFAIVDTVAEAG